MPRRKKLDLAPVMEALIAEIEFRISRTVKDAFHDIERRIDHLDKQLAGRGGRAQASHDFKQCRKPGCNGRVIAHRLCSRHYQQWRYHRKKATLRTPVVILPKAPVAARSKAPVSAKAKPAPRKRQAKATA